MSSIKSQRTEPTKTDTNRQETAVMTESTENGWAVFKPKSASYEDSLTAARSTEIWTKLYTSAKATDEKAQKRVRAGVYVYCALNGTSRVGTYGGELQLADGTVVAASHIPRAAGSEIRKFLRANMDESYEFFKESRVMEAYPRFLSRAADLGIGPQEAFATADWLTDCSLFTPAEKKAHSSSFNFSIQRAKRAREGKTLERVEGDSARATLHAQGQAESNEGPVDW